VPRRCEIAHLVEDVVVGNSIWIEERPAIAVLAEGQRNSSLTCRFRRAAGVTSPQITLIPLVSAAMRSTDCGFLRRTSAAPPGRAAGSRTPLAPGNRIRPRPRFRAARKVDHLARVPEKSPTVGLIWPRRFSPFQSKAACRKSPSFGQVRRKLGALSNRCPARSAAIVARSSSRSRRPYRFLRLRAQGRRARRPPSLFVFRNLGDRLQADFLYRLHHLRAIDLHVSSPRLITTERTNSTSCGGSPINHPSEARSIQNQKWWCNREIGDVCKGRPPKKVREHPEGRRYEEWFMASLRRMSSSCASWVMKS